MDAVGVDVVQRSAVQVIVGAGLPCPAWVRQAVEAGEDPEWELGSRDVLAIAGVSARQLDHAVTVGALLTVGDPNPGEGFRRRFTAGEALRLRAARIIVGGGRVHGGVPEALRLIPVDCDPMSLVSDGFEVVFRINLAP